MTLLETAPRRSQSEFEAGAFTITHFSDDPEGFAFETRSSIGRTGAFVDDEHLHLDEDQKIRLAEAMRREQVFNNVDEVKEARQIWKEAESRGDETAENLKAEFLRVRNNYISRGKKIGFRAVELAGNTLVADAQLVSFPTIPTLSHPEASSEVEKLSRAAAVALVVETSDNQLVVQHRAVAKQRIIAPGMTRGNALFADIPGASVAGMVDASLYGQDRRAGTPDSVDTDFLKANILKEAGEELGVSASDFRDLRIVGLAEDHIKPHDEVLFAAKLTLSAQELREVSRTSTRNKNLDDADFEEKFYTIEGSLNAIETFLTEIKCPLPPTHAAAMVTAGYALVLREQGKDAAHAWREAMQDAVRRNYEAIDDIVMRHYQTYPELDHHVPERYWNQQPPQRNLTGYSAAFTPEEQGLPSFEDELVRTGLMPENRRQVKRAKVLDMSKINEVEVYESIEPFLDANEPVCLTVTNSPSLLADYIIAQQGQTGLENLIIIGGKGREWVTFDTDGTPQHCSAAANAKDTYFNGALEADRYLEFLSIRKIKVDMFEASGKDEEIATELTRRGQSVVRV